MSNPNNPNPQPQPAPPQPKPNPNEPTRPGGQGNANDPTVKIDES